MIKPPVRIRLHDILESIDGIEETVAGVDFETYRDTWQIRRAVERGVEIISEASRQIPPEMKSNYPDIHWQEIASIGNLLRHEYQRVDDRVLWDAIRKHFPRLKQAVREMAEG